MKDQPPQPDFNSSQYERPNQKWVCGHAAEGKPCHLGPDAQGRCRVTFECQPALKTKPGETKGRYYCTRPPELGGPCANGPLPDGACARLMVKCVPVRNLRARRKILTFCVSVVTAALLLVALCGPYRAQFITPGKLSSPHATADFARLAGGAGNCAACHGAGRGRLTTWFQTAMETQPGPFQFHALLAKPDHRLTAIDKNCLVCHTGHSFHEPNVSSEHSCSECHVEHHGPGRMRAPSDANCVSCHGDAAVMTASADLGEKLPESQFDFRPDLGRVVFHVPRPKRGYTQIIHSFATDHPEFQIISGGFKDPDTLKFNHQLHLTPSRVTWQGHKLECVDCHKLDSSGVYHLKITFEADCRKCHALQFDSRNPGLAIPHGSVAHVDAFLRSLPRQYADYAARTLGPGDAVRNEAFAREQIALLRAEFGSGEELERNVFFNEKRSGPAESVGGVKGSGPAMFPGCAYCHEVKPAPNGLAKITPPVMPERWLAHSRFDHSKHMRSIPGLREYGCAMCHDAEHSRAASDILLPSKQICARCHSPAGGVADSCSTCHVYHSPRKSSALAQNENFKATDSAGILRKAVASRDK